MKIRLISLTIIIYVVAAFAVGQAADPDFTATELFENVYEISGSLEETRAAVERVASCIRIFS